MTYIVSRGALNSTHSLTVAYVHITSSYDGKLETSTKLRCNVT